ncbi:MAG: DUF2147 domain-containing protein [Smithellaceae bacterium]
MKKMFIFSVTVFVMLALSGALQAADPSIIGVWSVPGLQGAEKNKEKWQIEISEQNGRLEGKYVKLSTMPADALCTTCKKERKDKPLMGMVILSDMEKEANNYYKARVYDVEKGKDYRCTVSLAKPDILKVEACVLFICNSHYWTRVKE